MLRRTVKTKDCQGGSWFLLSKQVWGRAVKEGSGLCYQGEVLGRFGAHCRSGLLQVEQQGLVMLGGSTVPAPSRVCWKVEEQQRSVGRSHGQLSGLSGSLSSGGGLETGGTPGRERSWCKVIDVSLASQI